MFTFPPVRRRTRTFSTRGQDWRALSTTDSQRGCERGGVAARRASSRGGEVYHIEERAGEDGRSIPEQS
jgi:hypothetical protein